MDQSAHPTSGDMPPGSIRDRRGLQRPKTDKENPSASGGEADSFYRMLRLACAILVLFVQPLEATVERAAALDAMTGVLIDWFAGDFDAIEERATALMTKAPVRGEGRVDVMLAVSFAATITEQFDAGASVAAAAERVAAGQGMALAFVRAFNQASRGAPLAALPSPSHSNGFQSGYR